MTAPSGNLLPVPTAGTSAHLLRAGLTGGAAPLTERGYGPATERNKAGDEARGGVAARPHEAAEQVREQAAPARPDGHRRPTSRRQVEVCGKASRK